MSGGGSKGAFELGAVDYLVNEDGLDFKVIAGVSTGSLNATMLAQGADFDGLRDQLEQLKDLVRHIVLSRRLQEALPGQGPDSVRQFESLQAQASLGEDTAPG
jgi:predicted acylesterase/phospholipase RssA